MSYRADQLNHEEVLIVAVLDSAQANLEKSSRDYAEADAAYEERYAKAFLEAKAAGDKVTDKVAEAKAAMATARERLSVKIAEALMKSALSAVRVQMAKLNSWQSKCSNIKAEESATKAPEVYQESRERYAETTSGGWRCSDPDCATPTDQRGDHHQCTPW